MKNWFRNFSFKKESPEDEILRIMHGFVEVSFLGLEPEQLDDKENFKTLLMYLFGGIDLLTQAQGIKPQKTIQLMAIFLEKEFPEYESEHISEICNTILETVRTETHKDTMVQGANILQLWVTGDVPAAPFLLRDLFK